MIRTALAVLLLGLSTAASAQRLTLEMPVSPAPQVNTGALYDIMLQQSPLGPTALQTTLSAPSLTNVSPAATPGISATLMPGVKTSPVVSNLALPTLPQALVPTRKAAAIVTPNTLLPGATKPGKVIDSLKEHGALSGKVAELGGEEGALSAEKNFLNAASLQDPGDAASYSQIPGKDFEHTLDHSLLKRMLERVTLDDRGRADEKAALEDAFKKMLATPTGRHFAEQFLADGAKATIAFQDFPDSKLYDVGGRKRFYAAQAYTGWDLQTGTINVYLNRHYVDGDEHYRLWNLPATLGHELLGHGLWYHRAGQVTVFPNLEGGASNPYTTLYLAYHYYDKNEVLARTVGWAIDHELDGQFDESAAWSYLADPEGYVRGIKSLIAYYAATFSKQEFNDVVGVLKTRLAEAERRREVAVANLEALKSWPSVIDHFSKGHGHDAANFTTVRAEVDAEIGRYQNQVETADDIILQLTGYIQRLEAEPNKDSQQYLQHSGTQPFFDRLEKEVERMTKYLNDRVAKHPAPKGAAYVSPSRPAGHYTWDDLLKMYQEDVEADAQRPVGKKHWNH